MGISPDQWRLVRPAANSSPCSTATFVSPPSKFAPNHSQPGIPHYMPRLRYPLAAQRFITLSQIIDSIAAAGIVSAFFPGKINARISLGGGISVTYGLFIGTFLTAQLVFPIFMFTAEKHCGTFVAPCGTVAPSLRRGIDRGMVHGCECKSHEVVLGAECRYGDVSCLSLDSLGAAGVGHGDGEWVL